MFLKSLGNAITPGIAFALVSFCLGELGDGLNIFQGIYLVGIGWNESSVGLALSLMGFTALCIQTFAGDIVDKTTIDRRLFLTAASILTAGSALSILLVREGNQDHMLIFGTKIVEGMASSFIGPCLAALTLASFGPGDFDKIMASNVFWGHVGSFTSAILAGALGYALYPNIKYCFIVIGMSALAAVLFVRYLPEGNPLLGRGFASPLVENNDTTSEHGMKMVSLPVPTPVAASYWEVFTERKTCVLCLTGFFFHFANANVLLVLGELMGGDNADGSAKRSALPLIAGAIVLAQLTMSLTTLVGGKLTQQGCGRKILFLAGLITLPMRCLLIILWEDAGDSFLLSTQILDGIGGGLFGLLHPFLVADITFGTGRFNVVMGLTASCFGLGGTLSNLLGQMVVERLGHTESILCSLTISVVPIVIFGCLMPETYGLRGASNKVNAFADDEETSVDNGKTETPYVEMT